MSTPSDSIIKSSVHRSTGISKSLLTPCRRIGLSRKSKPTHSIFNNTLQEAQSTGGTDTNLQQNKDSLNPVNNSEDYTVSQAKELPSLRKKEEIKVIATEQVDAIDSIKIQNKRRLTKAVSTRNTSDTTNSKIASKIINKKSGNIERLDHLQKMVVEEKPKEPADTYTPPEIDLDNLKHLQSKELKVHVTRMDRSIKRKNVSIMPHRKAKRKLSMKKSTNSCDVDSFDTDDEIGLFTSDIPLENINLEDATVSANGGDPSLQQLAEGGNEKEDTSSLIDEILQLEKRAHEKEVHLSKLQQAEVYHNMHNVEDLDKLTNIWKSKCQEALQDLLEKLKEHALLDMPTLLKNLKVPSSLINYNCEEDIFV